MQQTIKDHYGDLTPIEVHNRVFSEFSELQYSDMIVYFDMLSKICALASNAGEHVRVKGITGASFMAYLMGATEINPLKPHYYCPHCRKIEFSDLVFDGWDLPAKQCSCGKEFRRDGHNLAFETLRFSIHRNVHFDLSVSRGLYPAVKEMIRTYFDGNAVVTLKKQDCPSFERSVILRDKLSDITNGQELPFEEYYDRLKQYPAITLTVSEDLDAYRKLEEVTKVSFAEVPFATKEVLDAFIQNDKQGIPEFRTDFFKDMVNEVHPESFHDIVQLSGLSHGTGVWTDNAQRLIQNGVPVGKVIAYRDDVFNYIQEKMAAKEHPGNGYAYQIMYSTFRGAFAKGGVSAEMRQQLSDLGMENWFADSLEKIGYVFPKAHGVLYVKYALILMWYKMHYPKEFAACMQSV